MSKKRRIIRRIARAQGYTYGNAIKRKFKIGLKNWNGSNR